MSLTVGCEWVPYLQTQTHHKEKYMIVNQAPGVTVSISTNRSAPGIVGSLSRTATFLSNNLKSIAACFGISLAFRNDLRHSMLTLVKSTGKLVARWNSERLLLTINCALLTT